MTTELRITRANWKPCKYTNGIYCSINSKTDKWCKGHSRTCGHYEAMELQGHKNHNQLKEKARQHLLKLGFTPNQIHTEYRVVIPVLLRVDVVGIKPNLKIGIECGDTHDLEKLKILQAAFDQVLRIVNAEVPSDYRVFEYNKTKRW